MPSRRWGDQEAGRVGAPSTGEGTAVERDQSPVSRAPQQPRYAACFVCGRDNPIGLQVAFFTEGERVRSEFTADARHQGYPGLVHGGILYALLDETIGRAAYLVDSWVMTGRLEVRYRRLAPIGRRILCTGWIVRDRGRAMQLAGEARLEDGTLLAEASGLFLRLSAEQRARMETAIFGAAP